MQFNKTVLSLILASLFTTLNAQREYKPIITGYDWGADINKVVLTMDKSIDGLNPNDFTVKVVPGDGNEETLSVLMVYPKYVYNKSGCEFIEIFLLRAHNFCIF